MESTWEELVNVKKVALFNVVNVVIVVNVRVAIFNVVNVKVAIFNVANVVNVKKVAIFNGCSIT